MTKILSNLADLRELLEASQAVSAAHLRQAQKAEVERDKLVGIVEKLISAMRCRSRDLYEASELLRDAGVAANGLCYDSSMTALDSAAWAERLLAEIRGGGGKS